ncbi:hypothetical protein CIRMBP1230_01073 [Enterococcus cecorum]|uniref:hypothetical protein n=1 Tax=Enterococcus cecorum TaxID=44008 RepID=UPI0022DB718F|nr:hypothetical protein [Enterococcus cecorum]CAI3298189.1 hypothetical protein CIRMBP1281_00653 [Enterococcus cecorum]CAI3299824.1 hypothetical protein CIRMBP1228_00645 [Enterococcus cecorum]CAI3312766.1 hypothetical protein CIRMBP1252_00803 [Enterococcus cecorum]CAI3322528.1 hypothetical protein CIRMBP1224_00884 [Enterococcus cecorum]CAI3328883.1 hypothetical protein CIRMBP1208_00768 [Enterococcus cecorum]
MVSQYELTLKIKHVEEELEKYQKKCERLFQKIFDYIDSQSDDLAIISVKEEITRLLTIQQRKKAELEKLKLETYPTDLGLVTFYLIDGLQTVECFAVKKGYQPEDVYPLLTGETEFLRFKEISVDKVKELLVLRPKKEEDGVFLVEELDERLNEIGRASYQSWYKGSLLIYDDRVV